MALFKATLNADDFDFEAYGTTKISARAALFHGLAKHGKQFNCPPDWFSEYLDSIEIREMRGGVAYRNGHRI